MSSFPKVNARAPLRNVAKFSILLEKVVNRRLDLPGIGCFYGPSGFGKTESAIFGANKHRAIYVECGQTTTAKSLLTDILIELGVPNPRGTTPVLVKEAIKIMSGDVRRPLIVDEAHWVAHKRFIDVLRELHAKSLAPIILIGEETLPKQLEQHERVHNRILDWVGADPLNLEDFNILVRVCFPKLAVADDLARVLINETRGNTRRIVVNLAKIEETAAVKNADVVDLATFGGAAQIVGLRAPNRRVA